MADRKTTPKARQTAETMAGKQRDISVSEFFSKNRHLLGFDNPRKALLTTVKEAVDNALDACEEAGILPDIEVLIEELVAPSSASKPGRYAVTITDNGPGIVRKQIENIFGRLLYGSKFHQMKMSRGQQGIGISAAGMYGLMTTGKPMVITTKPSKNKPAHHLELAMDTTRNKPEVTIDVETDDFPATTSGTGTRVRIEMEARYQRGKTSVEAYLEQTAIANPHAQITFIPPEKAAGGPGLDIQPSRERKLAASEQPPDTDTTTDDGRLRAHARGSEGSAELSHTTELADRYIFPRAVDELPPETEEIKPHPYGVELGSFLRMLKSTEQSQLDEFFKQEFSRVTPAVVKDITSKASTKQKTVSPKSYIKTVDHDTAERLYRALQDSKLRGPPTDCLAPIGVRQMLSGLLKGVKAEFYAASTRDPAVYRGNPFQIEAAIAFGGDLAGDESARVIRFANRVPLLYQQSACSSFKAVVETSWKNYGLSQPRGSLPVGPLVIMVHMASVWVPFTSESKEAIADYDEIRKEMRLALQECGRKLGTYLRRRQKMRREGQRRDVFSRYIAEIARSTAALTGEDENRLLDALLEQAQARTAIADAELDEDGNFVKKEKAPADDDGVIIIDSEARPSQVEAKSNGSLEKQSSEDSGRGLFGDDEEGVPVRRKKTKKKTRAGAR